MANSWVFLGWCVTGVMASETAEEAESEFATIRRNGGNIPSKEPVSFHDWIVDFYEIDEPKHLNKHLKDSVLVNERVNTRNYTLFLLRGL